ncbi:saccharopine dehydrogenase family protein [Pseudomonas sp. CGJS7]|uniref:saccharopine dehydrogenase family protein n=1 Tax=Pseudomonas sp. CGJS7 TaxID=3109348 RepID=UPI003008D00B
MSIDSALTPVATESADRRVCVFGAYGHTGRFVVARLLQRGWLPVLSGRDAVRLQALAAAFPQSPVRVASVDDPSSLDGALEGTVAVINCAGPFSETAEAVIQAALRAGAHYLDTAAEQQPVLAAFDRHAEAAVRAGIAVVPAMAFYGGLADLLASAAMQGWSEADSLDIAIALDSWHPTEGTRITGQRNTARRLTIAGGVLQPLSDPPAQRAWRFDGAFGEQAMVAVPFSEMSLISRHLRVQRAESFLNLAPLRDVRDPSTPTPVAADASGRSDQVFAIEVSARRNGSERKLSAQGRDIYAVTAPLMVEALERIVDGRSRGAGVWAPGATFDARDFIASLAPHDLQWSA